MSIALAAMAGALGLALPCLLAIGWMQRELRRRTRALRAQISEERIAAADEQSRMIAVATAECGHDVAWKMLAAAASRRSYELAREIFEDVS